MYDDIILEDIKIENKLVSSLFFIMAIFTIQNPIYLGVVGILFSFFYFLQKRNRMLFFVFLFVAFLSFYFSVFFYLCQMILLFFYFLFVMRTISFSSILLLLEKIMYRFRSRKMMNGSLFVVYWLRNIKRNIKKWKRNSIDQCHSVKEAFTQSVLMTNREVGQIVRMYQIRLFHQFTSRTSLEKRRFEVWDMNYFIFHLAIFIISVILGR